MTKDTSELPFWEGFSVRRLVRKESAVEIELQVEEGSVPSCGRCRQACTQVHERVRRRIRDLPMLGCLVTLDVQLQRLACPSWGHCQQFVSWLEPHARLTRRLAQTAAELCARMTVAHVAELFGLHWSTVRELDRRRLQALVDGLPPAQPQRLAMDEFAVFKGHRYASVIIDADTRRVLYVAQGRTRRSIRPFFEQLGAEGCARIEAVAMDMNSAFDLEVRHHCPRARIVYDLFHVVAKYGRDVVTRVRVDAANKLRQDKPARRLVKQAHWLLLRNRDRLSHSQQIHLDEVLAANQPLLTAYLMRDELKMLWSASSAWEWRARWRQWLTHAQQSAIPALQHFARSLKPYWRGIVSRVRWPMHTGQIEGINNRIKVIKRMAYGYRDTDYFFLKIRAAFPGNA
jgi:transposase